MIVTYEISVFRIHVDRQQVRSISLPHTRRELKCCLNVCQKFVNVSRECGPASEKKEKLIWQCPIDMHAWFHVQTPADATNPNGAHACFMGGGGWGIDESCMVATRLLYPDQFQAQFLERGYSFFHVFFKTIVGGRVGFDLVFRNYRFEFQEL